MVVARPFLAASLIALAIGAAPSFVLAQDAPAASTTPAETKDVAKTNDKGTSETDDPMDKKAPGRLPPHYHKVIDGLQRERIYKIQAEFAPRIKKLQEEIEALKKERDAKVEEVLTPEQRARVKEYEKEAVEK